jgi:hypothetical protein
MLSAARRTACASSTCRGTQHTQIRCGEKYDYNSFLFKRLKKPVGVVVFRRDGRDNPSFRDVMLANLLTSVAGSDVGIYVPIIVISVRQQQNTQWIYDSSYCLYMYHALSRYF